MISINQDPISIILLVVFLSSALGVIMTALWVYRSLNKSKRQKRIAHFVMPELDEDEIIPTRNIMHLSDQDLGKFRDWINESLSSLSSEKLQLKLSSAYWPITDTEYILLKLFATILGLILGWLVFDNILAGIFIAAIAILGLPLFLERAIANRQKQFQNQLLDVLILIKGAVQAGYGLMQAIDVAVKEIPAPASEEFGRVLREIRLGITMEGALQNLAERMESDDLQIMVTAMIINAQVGGNLSTVMEAVIATIRDRIQLMGEIRSLTSYARYVGNFLTLLPFIFGLAIFLLSPSHFDTVKTSIIAQIILVAALCGVIIGNIWIRQIVQIRV